MRLRRLLGRGGLVVFALALLYFAWIFLHVVWWNFVNPSSSAFMQDRLETLQEKNPKAKLRHQWVPYDKISLNLKRALVAAEDANFMEHAGFDWDAMQRAYAKNRKPTRSRSAKASWRFWTSKSAQIRSLRA